MKKIFTLFVLILALISTETKAQSITRLIGSSAFQDSVWVFDTTNFSVVRRFGPTPDVGGTLTGMNGIAKNPVTGTIYVINKQSAVSGRVLGKLNPLTGLVTIVGNLGDNFSSLTFTSDQKLYGTTGNGASVPTTLYQIDTATAAKRLVKTLGNGLDGEVICWNPDDNMLYHWSGNGTIVYEKFDTVTGPYNFINIPIIGTTNGETFGMVYRGNGVFIGSNIGSRFQLWDAAGNVYPQYGNSAPDDIRGTIFITCSRAITGATQFCTGSSTTLTSAAVNNVAGYQWYMNGVLIAGATSQSYVATAPGHYNCIVADMCGTDSTGTGVNVIENPLPVVNLGNDTATCATPVLLDAQNAGSSYLWNDGSTTQTLSAGSTGIYYVTVTNINGCANSDTIGITVNPLPVVNLGNDTATCATPVLLDAQNAGSSYLWNDGSTTQTLSATVTGTYSVTVTDANGCSNSDAIVITINPNPTVTATAAADTLCINDPPIPLSGSPFGGTFSGPGTSGVTFTPSSAGAGASEIYYMYTDGNGCSGSDSLSIFVGALPNVTVNAASTSVCLSDANVALTGTPAGGTFSGAGVSGNSFDPSVAGNGVHTVTYAYTDAIGCSNSATTQITVNACVGINEHASANGIELFPNPSNGNVQITLNTASLVTVYNAIGENVLSVKLAEGTHEIDLTGFAEGIYFVRTENSKGVSTQRLIISR
ncbi:MAG TPA: T9SS type A sorting domain-containing protein [Bacteroidia bacterium]|nr:T9SS type A sorting domain-containing protein [Bacteroidia bacterium]